MLHRLQLSQWIETEIYGRQNYLLLAWIAGSSCQFLKKKTNGTETTETESTWCCRGCVQWVCYVNCCFHHSLAFAFASRCSPTSHRASGSKIRIFRLVKLGIYRKKNKKIKNLNFHGYVYNCTHMTTDDTHPALTLRHTHWLNTHTHILSLSLSFNNQTIASWSWFRSWPTLLGLLFRSLTLFYFV